MLLFPPVNNFIFHHKGLQCPCLIYLKFYKHSVENLKETKREKGAGRDEVKRQEERERGM